MIAAKGTGHVEGLLEHIAADPAVPAPAQAMFVELGERIAELPTRVAELDRNLAALHRANLRSQQLAAVPGIGPIGALTVLVPASGFSAQLALEPIGPSTHGWRAGAGHDAWVSPCPSDGAPAGD